MLEIFTLQLVLLFVLGRRGNHFIVWSHGKIWGRQTMLNSGTTRTSWRSSSSFNLLVKRGWQ